LLDIIKELKITYKAREHLYLLVMILKNLINYKRGIINIKIGLVIIKIKGKTITINFIILLLGNNKILLGIL